MACQVVRQLLLVSISQNYLRRHGIFWTFTFHIRTLGCQLLRSTTYYEHHINILKIEVLGQLQDLVKMQCYGPPSHMPSFSIEQSTTSHELWVMLEKWCGPQRECTRKQERSFPMRKAILNLVSHSSRCVCEKLNLLPKLPYLYYFWNNLNDSFFLSFTFYVISSKLYV